MKPQERMHGATDPFGVTPVPGTSPETGATASVVGRPRHALARQARVYSYDIGPTGEASPRDVAVEAAIEICYGGQPFAVMMATPADLEDFAYGFSLTEGIVERGEDIRGVDVKGEDDSVRVDIALAGEALHAALARRRALPGRTGCGVCGVEDLAHLPRARQVHKRAAIAPRAIGVAVASLDAHQPLNAATRAAHGAAWASAATGEILLLREDVGRHNALDKCIGALLIRGVDVNDGFLLITSRCSHEMVVKASKLGASDLVSVSAPTTLALRRAEEAGMRLITVARADHALCFCGGTAA